MNGLSGMITASEILSVLYLACKFLGDPTEVRVSCAGWCKSMEKAAGALLLSLSQGESANNAGSVGTINCDQTSGGMLGHMQRRSCWLLPTRMWATGNCSKTAKVSGYIDSANHPFSNVHSCSAGGLR